MLIVLDLLHGPTQLLAQRFAMPINFAQTDVATCLRDLDHATDAFDVIKIDGQSLGHNGVRTQLRRCEYFLDLLDRARFAHKPSRGKSPLLTGSLDKRGQ